MPETEPGPLASPVLLAVAEPPRLRPPRRLIPVMPPRLAFPVRSALSVGPAGDCRWNSAHNRAAIPTATCKDAPASSPVPGLFSIQMSGVETTPTTASTTTVIFHPCVTAPPLRPTRAARAGARSLVTRNATGATVFPGPSDRETAALPRCPPRAVLERSRTCSPPTSRTSPRSSSAWKKRLQLQPPWPLPDADRQYLGAQRQRGRRRGSSAGFACRRPAGGGAGGRADRPPRRIRAPGPRVPAWGHGCQLPRRPRGRCGSIRLLTERPGHRQPGVATGPARRVQVSPVACGARAATRCCSCLCLRSHQHAVVYG
ncbi:hypothetical protein JYK04_08178 [Streptomyces nojiriensis]|nr:hypothetical protein JYK04_08178 [Streptomyces nojiriensis]